MPAPKAPKSGAGKSSGSPKQGEPVYLAVGLLRKPHGLRGDLLLEIYTDFPERIRPGTTILVGDTYQPLKITRRRPHNDGLILGFEGIDTPKKPGSFAPPWPTSRLRTGRRFQPGNIITMKSSA